MKITNLVLLLLSVFELGTAKVFQHSPIFIAGGDVRTLRLAEKLAKCRAPMRILISSDQFKTELQQLENTEVIYGNPCDEDAVQTAMSNCGAVVTMLNDKFQSNGEQLEYKGNSNVIEQAGILGIEKIIFISRYSRFLFYYSLAFNFINQ